MLEAAMRVVAPREIKEPEDLSFLSTAHLAEGALEIDLTDVEWISPLGVVAVVATCLRADDLEVEASLALPENRAVRTYLSEVQLLDELAARGWTLTSDGVLDQQVATAGRPGWSARGDIDFEAFAGASVLSRRGGSVSTTLDDIDIDPNLTFAPFLPVSRLTTTREVDLAADRLEDALRAAPHLRGGVFDELFTIAVELTNNAREHGSDCYAVAQAHSGRTSGTPGIHIAVADFGPGLAETLRGEYGEMSDAEAIVHAFIEQVSGTGESERGFGLTQIAAIVDRDPGSILHIISQSGHVVRTDRRFKVSENDALLFQGTLATAYLPSPFL